MVKTNKLFKFLSLVVIFALFASFAVPGKVTAASISVFINEIHYDNASTDAGEAIEVAGPAGTDLTGWSLVLYNGSGGAVYNTTTLSGTIPDLGGGFGVVVVNYPVNGIQNGSPDGLALVDAGNNVVQFLSYEGTFTAVGGAANGLTSTDIGVSESGSGPVGNSLQLTGTGTTYSDFSWMGESANTFGAFNTGQVFAPPPPVLPLLVINEIDYDQPGTDTAEFIEILNKGAETADLDGVSLELVNGTGGGASVYLTIDLSGYSLAAGDYFVVCANAATVVNCDYDVSPDSNLVQNGAPDAVGLRYEGLLIDAVSYEGNTGAPYTEGSGVSLEDYPASTGSISRCQDGEDTNQNNLDFYFVDISPGEVNACPPPEACGSPVQMIGEIQGAGLVSPLEGKMVSVEGAVTGDFQNNAELDDGNLNGFYLQETIIDGNPATSDGIFIYAPGGMDVNTGDGLRIRGIVSEFNGLTEITLARLWSCSTGNVISPTEISLPVASVDDFEKYEGMLVTFPQDLYISEYFNFDRYGEIVLTDARYLTPTAEFEPGVDAIAAAKEFLLSKITLDDGRTNQNPDPALHPNGDIFDLSNLFRGGDILNNVTGNLDYSFGLYRIQPTKGADYTPANPRTAMPEEVGGLLKVAAFNVLNYFTTLDLGSDICGPLGNQECRGADNTTEFTRQKDKIVSALTAIDADVFGLIEIENDNPGMVLAGYNAVSDLVDGLNLVVGDGTYQQIYTGPIGSDAIKVALIYKPATVTPLGSYAILDSTVDPRFLDDKNRPVLAQTFQDNTTGGIFTVAVNHLKSKGSDCNDVSDPDLGDGAGNCNLTRKAAAEALVDWLAADPTGSGDSDYLIIGDLNSYDKEDPIDVLLAGGYTDLAYHFIGEDAYSYVFDGQLGYLDYALASAGLLDEVTGMTYWHINADEPDLIDYDTSFKGPNQDAIYAPDAYRSSDHDPVICGLRLCDEDTVAPDVEVTLSPNILWPANHKYVEVTATVIANDNFDPDPAITLVSVTSNEPDDGLGDGDTPNDIVIIDDYTFLLRAERAGTGMDRVYTITYMVTDACGNTTYQSATVTVPHDQGK